MSAARALARRLACALTLAAFVVVAGVAEVRAQDADGDSVPDGLDNCPFAYNPFQEDAGGMRDAGPDGIGDVCQCGDLNGDGRVDLLDAAIYERDLAGLTPEALDPETCSVVGGRLDCEPNDRRALREGLVELTPGVSQVCQAALGAPPLPLDIAASGDSITRGFSATCTCNSGFFCLIQLALCATEHLTHSWFDGAAVASLHESYLALDPLIGADNSASVSGAEMLGGSDNFAAQADAILAQSVLPELVVVELGGNDICNRGCVQGCGDPLYGDQQWTDAVRAGLDRLVGHPGPASLPPGATVFLLGVPRIHDLQPAGIAKQQSSGNIDCESIWEGGLGPPICTIGTLDADLNGESLAERLQGISERVQRYNEILRDEALAYTTNANGHNPNGIEVVSDYVNEATPSVGTTPFGAAHINGGDCFHPNDSGQELLSAAAWDGNPRK